MKCGHEWWAPYLKPPPSNGVRRIPQSCVLERGHDGCHRSATNVIAPNPVKNVAAS